MQHLYKKQEAGDFGGGVGEAVSEGEKAKELIRRAIPLIERGWCRGQRMIEHPDGGNSFCMRGALFEASGLGGACQADYGKLTAIPEAEKMIMQWIWDNDFDPPNEDDPIMAWNDNQYRTHEQVIEAMRGASL